MHFILIFVASLPGSVNFVPQEMDVVLAKGKEDSRRKHYQRAIVHSIHVDKQWATVVWIDIGGSEVVEVSSLKPVNSDVMKVSIDRTTLLLH